jgi:hypothetical protein
MISQLLNGIGNGRRGDSGKAGNSEERTIAQLVVPATAYQWHRRRGLAELCMICGILLLTGVYPLVVAWRANRGTTLRSAIVWAVSAWAAWGAAFFLTAQFPGDAATLLRYVALCLTGCTAVAVLGARRPGVHAWNFVVFAQLAVFSLPLAEGLGELHLDSMWLIFLGGTLTIGLLNYLPTRLAAMVVALGIGCGVELALLHFGGAFAPRLEQAALVSRCLLAVSPWFAWTAVRAVRRPLPEFDQIWMRFRDRFGLVWSQRVREQFNRAAANAGWPVVLRWRGLRMQSGMESLSATTHDEIVATLRALLKRFGPAEE